MAFTPIAVKDGNGAAQSTGAFQDLASVNYPAVSPDNTEQTYRFSANFTPLATAAVTLIRIAGSASRTVRVKRILIGGVSTALSASVLQVLRVSSLGTGGTAITPTAAKNDSLSAAATAVVTHYTTAAQSSGTASGGPLATQLITTSTVTTPTVSGGGQPQSMFPELGAQFGQAYVLRGTADAIEIQNVAPTNLAAGTVLNYTVELVEDGS